MIHPSQSGQRAVFIRLLTNINTSLVVVVGVLDLLRPFFFFSVPRDGNGYAYNAHPTCTREVLVTAVAVRTFDGLETRVKRHNEATKVRNAAPMYGSLISY